MNTQLSTIQIGQKPNRAGFMFPRTFDEAREIAKTMIDSGCIPDWHHEQKNPIASVMMCLQKGIEVGLSPTEAIQKICRINGVLAIWGDAALGLCKISSDYEYCHETYDEAFETATCEVKRKNEPVKVIRTFSRKDAEVAGLWGKVHKRKSKEGRLYEVKSVWCYHPKRMLQMRARGFALRDCFPHVLLGLYLVEEFAGREEVEISPTEQKIIVLSPEQSNSQAEVHHVADSLKAKLKNKTAEIAKVETSQDLPSSFVEPKSLAIECQKSSIPELPMNSQTQENLMVLYEASEEFQKRIDTWLAKSGIGKLQDLKERQAQGIIKKLEAEKPEAREYWENYLTRVQIEEMSGEQYE